MLKPRAHHVVLLLDPDVSPSAVILRPDNDSIKICKRCHRMMEALSETRCFPKDEWEYDSRSGVPRVTERHFSHEIEVLNAPANPSIVRSGVVKVMGDGCDVEQIRLGMRVLIHFASGNKVDEMEELFGGPEYRIVHEAALLGEICE